MSNHRAVILEAINTPLSLPTVPTPTPQSGQVLIEVLAVPILSYTRGVLTGEVPFPLPVPFTPGVSPVGRIEAVPSDATTLQPGQLVFVDTTVRARDSQGIVPLENVHTLDEKLLVDSLKYSPARLSWINALLVPLGRRSLYDSRTGHCGRAAVDIALAMGAGRVIAVGRRKESLTAIESEMKTSKNLLDAGPRNLGADLFLDLTPGTFTTVSHVSSAISALKVNGRAILMGGTQAPFTLSYASLMLRNISVKGNFMFDATAPAKLIRLIETGNLSLERLQDVEFGLEDYEKAIDEAAVKTKADSHVVLSLKEN
ncbi:chaperonin 10-like protein [Lipomyces kononenkoae]|uniref:Chaperonin 10-like protein n=1 Tax=Lipomyces kononenkoae TaxID=34357 RepID=A0ACC3SRG3_LIPKO